MKIPFIFPAVLAATLSLLVNTASAEDTQESLDALKKRAMDSLTWGKETNGFVAGIRLQRMETFDVSDSAGRLSCTVSLQNLVTNSYAAIIPPKPGEGLDLELKDGSGKAIEKSRFGKSLITSLSTNATIYDHTRAGKAYGRHILKVPFQESVQLHRFGVLKCFKVEKPGTYELSVTASFYILGNRGKMVPHKLLPVSMKISVTEADLGD
jgi:hypothetical protein